jgi:hypothetical protein
LECYDEHGDVDWATFFQHQAYTWEEMVGSSKRFRAQDDDITAPMPPNERKTRAAKVIFNLETGKSEQADPKTSNWCRWYIASDDCNRSRNSETNSGVAFGALGKA